MHLHEEIWKWSSTLPDWQNDLLRRLYERSNLNEQEVMQVKENVLSSVLDIYSEKRNIKKLSKENIPNKKRSEKVKLKSLENLINVASVDFQSSIKFNTQGLTVIYGNNSAGKSSYAKVLKQSCRAVDNDTVIYPNIYEDDNSRVGEATINIIDENNEVQAIHRIMNTPPNQQLSHISIYDSKCGQIYAETENKVVFIPRELQIFNLLATTQNSIKENLNIEKKELENNIPIISGFKEETKLKSFINSLSNETTYEEIENMCLFTDNDIQRLEELNTNLRLLLEDNPEKTIKDLERKITDTQRFHDNIKKITEVLTNTSIDTFLSNQSSYINAIKTLQIAKEEAFNQQPLQGVGSNPWMKLWEAAKKYHDVAYHNIEFPNTELGSKCLLCQQDLNEEGKHRIENFEKFITNNLSKEKEEIEKDLNNYIEEVKSLPINDIKNASIREYLQYEHPSLEKTINLLISKSSEISSKIISAKDEESLEVPYLTTFPLDKLKSWIGEQKTELTHKKEIIKANNKVEIERERIELESKKSASYIIQDIKKLVDIKDKIVKYNVAINFLSTTSITKKYNQLASTFISDQFKSQIAKELNYLRCDNIAFDIKSRGTKGQTTIKLTVDSENKVEVSDIFSEGEQKALSLAFFLAEISSMENTGGIILDDPVSSFDQGRREYVAKRLIEEASNRQIVIFTHDIVFFHTLENFAKQKNISITQNVVRRTGEVSGITLNDDNLPWTAKNVKKRIGFLKQELQSMKSKEKNLDDDMYFLEVKKWYSLLRESWERAVEELMLAGVVLRFEPSIKTQELRKVKINDHLIQMVTEGMTKSSAMVHDESPAIGRMIPSLEEMQGDLKKLDSFKKEFN